MMANDRDTKPPLDEALARVGWLVPKWGRDVLVADFMAEQPDADGWHRITVHVKRREQGS